jgi:hypothetical protein
MTAQVHGFSPNWYYGQHNKGLAVYIATGSIDGVVTQGMVMPLLPNTTTYVWVTSNGTIQVGAELPSSAVYPVASVLSGIVTTGTGVNRYNPCLAQSPGVLSITDLRPLTETFAF